MVAARQTVMEIFDDAERKEAELAAKTAELTTKTAELTAKTVELAAKTTELETKKLEYTTCSMGLCDEPSVFGLRCSAGHGMCEEHSEDTCRAIVGHVSDTQCVVVGCDDTYCEASFERSGVPRDVVASCVERLHRDAFARETEAERLRERARRENENENTDHRPLNQDDLQNAVHLRRPCCGQIFGDFVECFAVTCDNHLCKKYFCGCCLDALFDRGRGDNEDMYAHMACHEHVRECAKRHFGKDTLFFQQIHDDETPEQVKFRLNNHYEGVRSRKLASFLKDRGVDVPPPPVNTIRDYDF